MTYVSPPLVPASRVLSSETQMRSAAFLLRTLRNPTDLFATQRPSGFSSNSCRFVVFYMNYHPGLCNTHSQHSFTIRWMKPSL